MKNPVKVKTIRILKRMVIRSDKRANDYDEIKPLIDLCKAGRFLMSRTWIADGKTNQPAAPSCKRRRKKDARCSLSSTKVFTALYR
ncbi:MAG: hypothetical protein U5R30_21635 [Deltaproteobacteria bacterium]|nr:hypothetical protein [Deltaproteobacteria bacterium]